MKMINKKYLTLTGSISLIFFVLGYGTHKFQLRQKFFKLIKYTYNSSKGIEDLNYPHIYAKSRFTNIDNKIELRIINNNDPSLVINVFSATTGELLERKDISSKLKKITLKDKEEYESCFNQKGNNCKNFHKAEIQISSKGALVLSTKESINIANKNVYPNEYFLVNNFSNDYKSCDIGLVYPDYTWSAYNNYGGRSLYTTPFVIRGRVSSNVVTANRPNSIYEPHNLFPSSLLQNTIKKEKKCVVPLTNSLMDNSEEWKKFKLIVLTSHDEYWTKNLRQEIHKYVKNGGNLAVFSGNTAFRVFEVKKDKHRRLKNWAIVDPIESTIGLASRFGLLPIAENNGVCNVGVCPICTRKCLKKEFAYYKENNDMTRNQYENLLGMQVLNPSHPFFRGTGLSKGSFFGSETSLLYHEIDGAPYDRKKEKIHANIQSIPLTGYVPEGLGGFDFTEIKYQKPKNIKPLAGAWLTNWDSSGIQYSATFVDLKLGKGRVVNGGSVGWYKSISKGDIITEQIFLNVIKDLSN